MINDDVPREPGYTYGGNTYDINWREALKLLRDMGVKIYGLQSGCDSDSTKFNQEMAKVTNGKHLALKNFSNIFDFIMMICYGEGNPDMLPRENVSDAAILTRGPLNDFKWTKWTCAIRASTPSLTERKQFGDFVTSKRYPGYIAKHIFCNDIGLLALYEFGVKSPEARRRKIHVVYFRRINGIQNRCRWDMHFFRHKSIKAEVEKVIKGNCSVWVRHAMPNGRDSTSKLKQLDEGENYIKRFYDYAWKKYIWRRSENSLSHRDVRIGKFGGLAVSNNNL